MRRKELTDEDRTVFSSIKDTPYYRLKVAGYTLEQIEQYREAVATQNDEMLENLECKCKPDLPYVCPKCQLYENIKRYNYGWSAKGRRKNKWTLAHEKKYSV